MGDKRHGCPPGEPGGGSPWDVGLLRGSVGPRTYLTDGSLRSPDTGFGLVRSAAERQRRPRGDAPGSSRSTRLPPG
jgi:hypothetical protein